MLGVTEHTQAGWIGLVPPGVSIPFDSIRAPGTYVCNWNGHLLRVPESALVPDGVINLVGPEPLFVTRSAMTRRCHSGAPGRWQRICSSPSAFRKSRTACGGGAAPDSASSRAAGGHLARLPRLTGAATGVCAVCK